MSLSEIAIRLADEGVPRKAICRSTGMTFDDLQWLLRDAVDRGRLLEMPPADWKPGLSRDDRAVKASAPKEPERRDWVDDVEIPARIRLVMNLTRQQIRLLIALAKGPTSLEKLFTDITIDSNIATDKNLVRVQISKMRGELARHGIEIQNVFGFGYRLSEASRQKVLAIIQGDA